MAIAHETLRALTLGPDADSIDDAVTTVTAQVVGDSTIQP